MEMVPQQIIVPNLGLEALFTLMGISHIPPPIGTFIAPGSADLRNPHVLYRDCALGQQTHCRQRQKQLYALRARHSDYR